MILALSGWMAGAMTAVVVVLAVVCFGVMILAVWFNDERGE